MNNKFDSSKPREQNETADKEEKANDGERKEGGHESKKVSFKN